MVNSIFHCLLLHNAIYAFLLGNVVSLVREPVVKGSTRSVGTHFKHISMLKGNGDLAIESFEKSWGENGINAKSVKHTSFDWICGKLRGLQATTSQFKKNSVVLSVPIGITLSASDSGMEGCPPGFEKVWGDLKGTSRVSLLLMKEWLSLSSNKGSKSKFASYIEALPAPGSLGTPFHWAEENLQNFPYQPLVKSVSLQRKRWIDLYSEVEKSNEFAGVSYERFVWAMEMVRSRAFTGLGGSGRSILPLAGTASAALIGAAVVLLKTSGINEAIPIALGSLGALCLLPAVLSSTESVCAILPAIDSSNHDGSNPVCNIALEPARGCFQMVANRDIVAGEQITISYGNRHNDDLLQYFGFVEVDCAFDRYVVLDPLSVLEAELAVKTAENSEISQIKFLKECVDQLVKESGSEVRDSNRASTSKFSMIMNRNEIGTWTVGALDSIKDKETRNRCMQIIITSEIQRMKIGLENISTAIVQPEVNPCILRTFLSEKIKVLNAASTQIGE